MKFKWNRRVIVTVLFYNVLGIIFFIICRLIFFPTTTSSIYSIQLSTETETAAHGQMKLVYNSFIKTVHKEKRVRRSAEMFVVGNAKKRFTAEIQDSMELNLLLRTRGIDNGGSLNYNPSTTSTWNEMNRGEQKLNAHQVNENTQSTSWHRNYADVLCDDRTPGTKKILSYSLFGRKAQNLERFIKNVSKQALTIDPYKDFTLRIYVDKSFLEKNRDEHRKKYSNVRFCDVTRIPVYGDISNAIGTVWRFIPMADTSIDVFCSRDLDSPLLQRGGDAVKEFLKSNATLHVMRDERFPHGIPIMGGMWCYRPPKANISYAVKLLKDMLQLAKMTTNPKFDQFLLERFIWDAFKNFSLQHDVTFQRL